MSANVKQQEQILDVIKRAVKAAKDFGCEPNAIAQAVADGVMDFDHTHCDECGEIIDSAKAGCQSAGENEGCKGWDYQRDVLGFEMV